MRLKVFQHPLKKVGLHIDFLRLNCGAEPTFRGGIRDLPLQEKERPRVFIAFAEWDAVIVLPCERLYPPSLNDFYGTTAIARSIAGNAGYFSYLWDHPINEDLHEKLDGFESTGVAFLISLRFEDWLRNKFGLAAELMICDALQKQLRSAKYREGISAVVSHTLGWNDVAVLLHASKGEERLTGILSWLRILTLHQIHPNLAPGITEEERHLPLFAASYTHLIAGYDRFQRGKLDLGRLDRQIIGANLLVRVPASFEPELRNEIWQQLPASMKPRRATPLDVMPSEMGHYSFSVNVSDMAKKDGAREVLDLVRKTRHIIGRIGRNKGDSYAETSTIFTFREPQHGIEKLVKPSIPRDLSKEIGEAIEVLKRLPDDLRAAGASPLTIHRFSTVLVTLIDHLSDPVRNSAVRHVAGFLSSLPDRIGGLSREGVDDLCHVCEAAVGQAIDGIAQFQHDANSIGLSGRGGYTRLIVAIEMFARDIFSALRVKEEPPLITFGLRTGTPGSLDRFQIDMPFRVVFTPSDWYVLLHEVGHHCWIASFAWMTESIATYEALSREIMLNLPKNAPGPKRARLERAVRAQFISTRSIVRELFPNLLVYRLGCGSNLDAFDQLSMHHVIRTAGKNDGTRSMLIAVVLHCLLDLITVREKTPRGRSQPRRALTPARDWWSGWQEHRRNLHKSRHAKEAQEQLRLISQNAIDAVTDALDKVAGHQKIKVNDKHKILGSEAFQERVIEALEAVIDVLAFSNQQFGVRESPASQLFNGVQAGIKTAAREQTAYEGWREHFGQWLGEGEVFALAPRGYVWLRLLLEADKGLRPRSSAKFMVSQLSLVLSMWHRTVTARPSGKEAPDRLNDVIRPLGYITTLPRKATRPTTTNDAPG